MEAITAAWSLFMRRDEEGGRLMVPSLKDAQYKDSNNE